MSTQRVEYRIDGAVSVAEVGDELIEGPQPQRHPAVLVHVDRDDLEQPEL